MIGYKRFFGMLMLVFLVSPSSGLSAKRSNEDVTANLDMEALVKEANADNPSIRAARREAQAAKLRVRPSRILPDPTVTLGIQALPVDTFAFDEWDMTQKVIGFTQPLPFPGKLKLAAAVARSNEKAAVHQVRIFEDQLAFDVRRTFLEWAYAEEAVRITGDALDIIAQFTQIATARYAVGKAAQWDVLRAQVEHSKLSERLVTLKQKIDSFRAVMAKLLGRDKGRIEGIPQVRWSPLIPLDEKALIRRAEKSNPRLAYLRSISERAGNTARLARKQRLPDFTLTFAYGQRDNGEMNGMPRERPDFVSGILGIKIPLYARLKQTPLARAAEHQAVSARRMLENERLRICSEIRDRVFRIRRAEAVEKLYRTGILPQARTTVQSALASYQVDKVDFLTLLTSELTLLNHELDYYKVRIDREVDFAALTLLLGEPVLSKGNVTPTAVPARKGRAGK